METLMKLTRVVALALVAVLPASLAAAQSEPTAEIAAAPAPTGASSDPNIDRGFLLPTAETQPAGSITFNDYQLFFVGLTYGITDSLQVSASALLPVLEDTPTVVSGSGKLRLVATDRFRLAAHASATALRADGDGVGLATLGGTGSLCLDAGCHSMLSATVGAMAALDDGVAAPAVFYGLSATRRVAPRIKLLAEVAGAALDVEDGTESLHGVSYGVRFFAANIAADVGFVKPIGADDPFVLGFPFLNVSYRSM
jgi:hypothetical protein